MPIEDRIEQFARLVLVILLFATLGWISHAKAENAVPVGDALNKQGLEFRRGVGGVRTASVRYASQ